MIKFLDLKKINESFEPELSAAVERVIKSGIYLFGEENSKFDEEFAEFIGTTYSVGVGSGLDALRLIFRAYIELGMLKEGDEVIVPANTYIASILAITDNKLIPVFAEPDIQTYNLSYDSLKTHISDKTKAVLLVHLYGKNAITPELEQLVKQHNLLLIEDNAQAAGCFYGNKRTGSLGHAAGHSFYPTKNMGALGDGGAITTDIPELAEVIRILGNYGSYDKNYFKYQGYNSRLDEIQAAVLRIKLKRLDKNNQHRREIAEYYLSRLDNIKIMLPGMPGNKNEHVWHQFVIRIKNRRAIKQHLEDNHIETLVHYPLPPHKQMAYEMFNKLSLPVTERLSNEVLSLPISPVMANEEVEGVVKALGDSK